MPKCLIYNFQYKTCATIISVARYKGAKEFVLCSAQLEIYGGGQIKIIFLKN